MCLEKFIIDAKKPTHISWWAARFNVPEDALLAAIGAVGNRAECLQMYLDEQARRGTSLSTTVTAD